MSKKKVLVIPLAFISSLMFLYLLAKSAPSDDEEHLSFPSSLESLKNLSHKLNGYQENHPAYVLTLFSSAYVFKQTFAIPGSVFLNVLAGAIFGFSTAFFLCCFLTASGASLCFFLARFVGKDLAVKFFPEKIKSFRQKLSENKNQLPFYLLFLRLFPMSPNWALNMACGVLGVSAPLFFLTVLFGLMPYNYMCVQSGIILSEIQSMDDILSWGNLVRMITIALVALAPTIVMKLKSGRTKMCLK